MVDVNNAAPYVLRPIGFVRSDLKRLEDCPHQGCESAPNAWLDIDPAFADGLDCITSRGELIVLTWLHKARRNVLKLHPRNNPANPLRGVFSTRSPNRPNPVGLHRVEVLQIEKGNRLLVGPLEVLDGTPIIDIKPLESKSQSYSNA